MLTSAPFLGGGEAARRGPLAHRRHAGAEHLGPNFVANFWQIFARSRLYRHRSLQVNTRCSAFLISTRLSS